MSYAERLGKSRKVEPKSGPDNNGPSLLIDVPNYFHPHHHQREAKPKHRLLEMKMMISEESKVFEFRRLFRESGITGKDGFAGYDYLGKLRSHSCLGGIGDYAPKKNCPRCVISRPGKCLMLSKLCGSCVCWFRSIVKLFGKGIWIYNQTGIF